MTKDCLPQRKKRLCDEFDAKAFFRKGRIGMQAVVDALLHK